MKKNITILGSTGSIGLTALSILEKKKKYFKLKLLSANKNYSSICKQIKKYKPNYFLVTDFLTFQKIKKKFSKKKIIIINNINSFSLKNKIDVTISAIPGVEGLETTLLMTKLSKKILIANKESVICGWNLLKKIAKKNKTKIVPIDSEHYSISKLIENHKISEIKRIYITASGGPFLNYAINKFKKIKPQDALKHPKWKMGKKISIDSSTLMNKILELIEAQKFFNIPEQKLEIVIHPESLVHAIVEFKNGLTKLLYHQTSMKIPIANALFDGQINIEEFLNKKPKTSIKNKLDNLSFQLVNPKIFPIIKLKKRLNEFPSTPIIINAANEILVDQFLQKNIPFLKIYKTIMTILNDRNYRKYAIRKPKNINQILTINNWAKLNTLKIINN